MEEKRLPKGRLVLALAALFLSTCCTMGDMALVPIFSTFYEIFDNVAVINMIATGPGIIGLFFCLLGGRLTDIMDKKLLMTLGFALHVVSSVFGGVFVNQYYIMVCRLLSTGAAWGITSSAALGIIAELYPDETRRGTVNGWYNSAMAAIGAVLSFAGGLLAVKGWQNAYKTYWLTVPVLVMLILFLPSMPPRKAEQSSGEKVKGEKGWYKNLIPLMLQVILVGISYYVNVYMISLYVTDTGIGSEAFTGTLSSIGTVTSCIAGLIFGLIYGKLKKATPIIPFVIIGIGFLIMGFQPSALTAAACCACMGISWGIFYSFFYTECSVVVPENMQGTAIGITGAVNGLASFLCSYVVTGLQSIMHAESSAEVFPVFGAVCLMVAAVSAIGAFRNRAPERQS